MDVRLAGHEHLIHIALHLLLFHGALEGQARVFRTPGGKRTTQYAGRPVGRPVIRLWNCDVIPWFLYWYLRYGAPKYPFIVK
jgi:hypothetical protein